MQRKECDKLTIRGLRRQSAIAILTLIAATPALAGGVQLWPQAVVTDDAVMLRDVCRLTGFSAKEAQSIGDIVLMDAPPVGGSAILALDHVRSALRASGANMAGVTLKGAASCNISRPQRIERERRTSTAISATTASRTLHDAIESFFTEELARHGGRVQLQFGRVDESILQLSEPQFTFDMHRTSGQTLGLVGIEVKVLSRNEVVQSVPILLNVSLIRDCIVAARGINLGQTVTDADVRTASVTFSELDDPSISDPAAVVGQRARRFIAEGRLITASELEPVPLVKRGQVVNVYSRVGGVSVVTAAKSLDSGAYGQVVELRSTDRMRKTFTATVTGAGSVEVGAVSANATAGAQLAMGGEQ